MVSLLSPLMVVEAVMMVVMALMGVTATSLVGCDLGPVYIVLNL